MTPTSRGTVKLASADPSYPPLVDPNGYAAEADRCSMREGIRQMLRLMLETAEGKDSVEDVVATSSQLELTLTSSDEDIDEYVRTFGATAYHAARIAAMGDVVDGDLKVRGIRGLRVVDASVLPVSIAAHLQVPLYALAEQAADIILGA